MNVWFILQQFHNHSEKKKNFFFKHIRSKQVETEIPDFFSNKL